MSNTVDNVNNPKHYEGHTSLECIECMRVAFGEEAVYHFCLCNAFKYLWRYKNKNGAEDIDKAKWYLNYVQRDIMEEKHISFATLEMCRRLNNLYIDIVDNKIE